MGVTNQGTRNHSSVSEETYQQGLKCKYFEITLPSTLEAMRQKIVGTEEVLPVVVKEHHGDSDKKKGGLSDFQRGIMAIVGGFFTHMTLGSLYCWGNFISYAPQNLMFFSGVVKEGTPPDALKVLPITILAQVIAIPIGPSVIKLIGCRQTVLLGCWLAAFGVFVASFQTSLKEFMKYYAIMFGLGCGLAYTAPLTAGFKWLPASKGMVSGGVLTGFGLGGFIFNLIGSRLVNPKGLDPVNDVFPSEVYDAFPHTLRTLSITYMCVSAFGALLITEPSESSPAGDGKKHNADTLAVPGASVEEAVRSPQLWMMWMMVLTGGSAGLNVASVYKSFAATSVALSGDGYLSLVGGIGAILNGLGRLFWGIVSDKYGFKNSWIVLAMLQSILGFMYPFSADSKIGFLVATACSYFFLAGAFALIPSACQKVFGPANGTTIYGIVMTAFGFAAVGGNIFTMVLVESAGWQFVFIALATMSMVAGFIGMALEPMKTLPSSTVH